MGCTHHHAHFRSTFGLHPVRPALHLFPLTVSRRAASTLACSEKDLSASCLSRRSLLASAPAFGILTSQAQASGSVENSKSAAQPHSFQPSHTQPDYTSDGPFDTLQLPKLEHACTPCFPACTGSTCLARICVTVPKGGAALGKRPPYPLALLTNGFLINSEAYFSYAERLASWGYTVMRYDTQESFSDGFIDDDTSVAMLRELMDYAESDPLLSRVADVSRTYLVGHSRGGKISVLAAAEDTRVVAVCLLDPVDNTVYAPLGPGYPSALSALRGLASRSRVLPVAVVGTGLGGSCAPQAANHEHFFAASSSPAMAVCIQDAGHFQFLDSMSPLQRAICEPGLASDQDVRGLSQAVMVAWGEAMVQHAGQNPSLHPASKSTCTSNSNSSPTSPIEQPLSSPSSTTLPSSDNPTLSTSLSDSTDNHTSSVSHNSHGSSGDGSSSSSSSAQSVESSARTTGTSCSMSSLNGVRFVSSVQASDAQGSQESHGVGLPHGVIQSACATGRNAQVQKTLGELVEQLQTQYDQVLDVQLKNFDDVR